MDNEPMEDKKQFQTISLSKEIGKEIAELESKLSPILLSSSPTTKEDKEENISDLMRELRSICGRIVDIKSRIDL